MKGGKEVFQCDNVTCVRDGKNKDLSITQYFIKYLCKSLLTYCEGYNFHQHKHKPHSTIVYMTKYSRCLI
jgi:hypothetical protein